MIRKYHDHKLQTTPWHREEEPLNHHETPGRQIKQSNQLSLSLISRTDKGELIAIDFFQQSCVCLGYLEQHTKSCKSYLVGKYIFFRLKNDHFYA